MSFMVISAAHQSEVVKMATVAEEYGAQVVSFTDAGAQPYNRYSVWLKVPSGSESEIRSRVESVMRMEEERRDNELAQQLK